MGIINSKKDSRFKRKRRIRKKIVGTYERPRLSVFRSAKHVYVQIIDDDNGQTLVAASSLEQEVAQDLDILNSKGKLLIAKKVGELLGNRAQQKGIRKVVFDRNGFKYHGRVKAISEGARNAGLDF